MIPKPANALELHPFQKMKSEEDLSKAIRWNVFHAVWISNGVKEIEDLSKSVGKSNIA